MRRRNPGAPSLFRPRVMGWSGAGKEYNAASIMARPSSSLCARHTYCTSKDRRRARTWTVPWEATHVRDGDLGRCVTWLCGTALSACTGEERHSTLRRQIVPMGLLFFVAMLSCCWALEEFPPVSGPTRDRACRSSLVQALRARGLPLWRRSSCASLKPRKSSKCGCARALVPSLSHLSDLRGLRRAWAQGAGGDLQSPEGFYVVTPEQMNPDSHYHLAFDLGYPNAYDQAYGRTGSALMVHGNCVSAGCYAMTDTDIEEIYTLADAAFRNGQPSFAVHISISHVTEASQTRAAFTVAALLVELEGGL